MEKYLWKIIDTSAHKQDKLYAIKKVEVFNTAGRDLSKYMNWGVKWRHNILEQTEVSMEIKTLESEVRKLFELPPDCILIQYNNNYWQPLDD
jgi:uncharacterized protein involved in tolerance to divalent cations